MLVNPFKEPGARRFGYYFLQGYNAHTIFCEWVKERWAEISTVLEVGCGSFEYYSYFFGSLRMEYTGLDISQDIIDFRKKINPEQKFVCADFWKYKPPMKYNLVYHHMVLSGLLSTERNLLLLKATIAASNAYGFGVFWNTQGIVAKEFESFLINEGCKNVSVFEQPTGLHKEQPQHQLIVCWEKTVDA